MPRLQWGIIGFGEAGSTFAKHISEQLQRTVFVTDPLLNQARPPARMQKQLNGALMEVLPDVAVLVSSCHLVLSLVPPRAACAVATESARGWRHGLYVDFNSTSPKEKQAMATCFPKNSFIDGAILGSIAGEGAATNLALAGAAAKRASTSLRSVGLKTTVVGPQIGMASALKMCRSIFMKGIECLFVETLLAASELALTECVLSSIEQTFTCGVRSMAQILIATHAVHCGRRSDEIRKAVGFLKEMGLPARMGEATREFLTASHRSGLTEHFEGVVPKRSSEVIQYLRNSLRKKR